AFRLIDEAQLLLLQLRHESNLFLLHRDLMLEHFSLALGGQIARRAHRQRVGYHTREARDQNSVPRLAQSRLCANHPGNEAEVGSQAVVEAVHHVTEKAPGPGLVPWLA